MEPFPLLDLPIDIIYNLLHTYFDPISSLRCLRVCKELNQIGNRDLIIKKVLLFRMVNDFERQLNECIICHKCHIKISSRERLKLHLQKHDKFERKGKVMKFGVELKIDNCYNCDVPISNFTEHICLARLSMCYNGDYRYVYKWSKSLCKQHDWYISDPNFKEHKCYSQCLFCKEVFKSGVYYPGINKSDPDYYTDGFQDHIEKCPYKDKILKITV